MAREHDFKSFLPSTKELLLKLHHNSYDNYLAGYDLDNKELTLLEEVCVMHEYSFQFDTSGLHGLKLLGITYNPENRISIALVLLEALIIAVNKYISTHSS